jgi:hypothetical protein
MLKVSRELSLDPTLARFLRSDYGASGLNAILKAAWQKVGEYWHQHFREEHFKNSAMSRYGYTPRRGESGSGRPFKGSYTQKKLAIKKHTRPLVWSGESMRRMEQRDVRARKDGVRIHLHAPVFNFHPAMGRVDMAREMTRVTDAEFRELETVFDEHVDNAINALVSGGR